LKALILSGGGGKCLAEIGVLEYLLEQDSALEYQIIAGNSGGALNAAFLASSPLAEAVPQLKDIWLNQVKGNHSVWEHHLWYYLLGCICAILFVAFITFALFLTSAPKIITIFFFICIIALFYFPYRLLNNTISIYKTGPLRDLITKNLDIEKLKNSGKKLIIGTTCYDTGEYKSIQEIDENIIDWIMASSAYPIFFPMMCIDNNHYVDGGITSLAPLSDVLHINEVDQIDIIITSPFEVEKTNGKSAGIIKQLIRTLDIISSQTMQTDFLVRSSIYPGLKIRYFIPEKQLASNPLDFSPDKLRKIFDEGREIAKRKLK
jgi:predicted acylesterase/phospholipase RssA